MRVEVEGDGNLTVDLRTKHSDASTSVTRPEGVEDGKATLTVTDDGLEGTSATLVVLDEAGNVLAKQPTPPSSVSCAIDALLVGARRL